MLQSAAGRQRPQPQQLLRLPLGFGGGQQQVVAGHQVEIRHAPQAAEGIGQQRPAGAALQLPQGSQVGAPGLGSAAPRPGHDQAGSIWIEPQLRSSALPALGGRLGAGLIRRQGMGGPGPGHRQQRGGAGM